MAPKCLFSLPRTLVASPVQLPIFLVPSASTFTTAQRHHPQSRSYASHKKRTRLENSAAAADNRKPKLDFAITTKIRQHRDKNKSRGVSAIRSTGPKHRLKAVPPGYALPVPAKNAAARRKEYKAIDDHGLWGFFYDKKKPMNTPEAMSAHGRAWTYQELSVKSFEDLHSLFWVGHKELNRIKTNSKERDRVQAGYGDYEDTSRLNVVLETSQTIRKVLVDRYMNVQEANSILQSKTLLKDLELDEETENFYPTEDLLRESQSNVEGSQADEDFHLETLPEPASQFSEKSALDRQQAPPVDMQETPRSQPRV